LYRAGEHALIDAAGRRVVTERPADVENLIGSETGPLSAPLLQPIKPITDNNRNCFRRAVVFILLISELKCYFRDYYNHDKNKVKD